MGKQTIPLHVPMTVTTAQDLYAVRLAGSLPRVRDEIARAAQAAGRAPDEVRLVAVTKGHPLEAVRAAVEAGLTDLGENRVTELEAKVAAFGRSGVSWHMIGHLQRRKVPAVLPLVDLVHSVDTVRLAERISRVAVEQDRTVDVLVQVNTSGEEAKGGLEGPGVVDEVLAVAGLASLRVRGLMTMAPFVDDEPLLRRTFSTLRRTLEEVRRHDPTVGPHLSMGMTNDLRFAVEEGSTMVRIGTALFGERAGAAAAD